MCVCACTCLHGPAIQTNDSTRWRNAGKNGNVSCSLQEPRRKGCKTAAEKMEVRGKQETKKRQRRESVSLQTMFRSFLKKERVCVWCVCVRAGIWRGLYTDISQFLLLSCVRLRQLLQCVCGRQRAHTHTLSPCLFWMFFISSVLFTHSHFISNFATSC